MHILRLSEWWRWRRWARSRFKLLIPILTMIKRKMANRRRERKKNAQSQSIHDNNSKYIVFNMSLNANVNTIELSNGYNHTEFTYCRASDIYLFGCCCWFFFILFLSLVETWLIWPQNTCILKLCSIPCHWMTTFFSSNHCPCSSTIEFG